MADHSKPTITSLYADFVTELNNRFTDLSIGLDPALVTPTNVPTNTIRWSSAALKWQKWNGTAWNDLAASYSININGTVGATTPSTGAFTTLSTSGVASLAANSTVNSVAIVGTTLSQTLTNKTLTTPLLSATASGTAAGSLGYLSGVLSFGDGSAQRTVVTTDNTQTLSNKTFNSTGNVWNGGIIGVTYGGTGTSTAPVQGGIIYGSSTTAYGTTAVGTAGQVLQSNGTSAPTWVNFDLAVHAPDSSYKKIVRVATTTDVGAATFATDVLTGYPNTKTLASTTVAASTTITTSGSTADLKVGSQVSTATIQVAAGTTVASISNATTFLVNNRAAITTTAITGNGTTATATFAAQTYAPYAVGASIVITGATPATYNGTFTVTACTTTSVSWASAETVTATVQGAINFTIAAGSPSLTFAQTIAALNIDGVALALNDRVLVKDQFSLGGLTANDAAKYNGIYYVSAVGSTTVAWTLTRAADANSSTEIDGAIVNVSVGTANGGKAFKTYFKGTDTLNTTAMYWNRLVDEKASYLIPAPSTGVGIDLSVVSGSTLTVGGNVTDYAINSLGQETLLATSASTYTRGSTLYIAGAPVASTNVTITTPYALYIAAGNSYMAGNLSLGGDIDVAGGDITTSAATFGLVDTTATTVNFAGAATTSNFGYDGTAAATLNLFTGATAASTTKTLNIGTGGAASSTTNITVGSANGGTLTVNSPNTTFNQTAAGVFKIQASAAPTVDMVQITNTGQGVATAGASLLNIAFTGGAAAVESSAAEIAVTPSATASSTWSALRVSPTAAAATSVSQYGVKFDNITAGAGTDSMIYAGTGWDNIINYNATSIIDGSGIIRKAAGVTAGSTTDSFVIYNGTTAANGQFDGGTTNPSGTTRLNYGGILYPTGVNLVGTSDTTTAATHYFVETATDGQIRPKTLANVQSEIVTNTAVNAAAATTVGTVTTGTWNATTIAVANGGTGATTADAARVNLNVITGTTGSQKVPSGTTAQRDASPAAGYFRFNSTLSKFEGHNGTAWGAVGGGATGGGADDIFIENGQTVTTNYSITANKNAMTTGPVTVNSGITVTVPSGSRWVIL
jgi:hypothetical protein